MQKRHVKHPFPAVIDKESRILILGSVPSVKSVEGNFYYMHPQNRFWKVLGALFNENFYDSDIDTRKELLHTHGIAMYDSVEECDIVGSSDSAIENIVPADIPSLVRNSRISQIFCNGNASYKYLAEFHPQLAKITQKLPSTSPANAAFSLERLIDKWRVLLEYLS